jgi:hypothetical protein
MHKNKEIYKDNQEAESPRNHEPYPREQFGEMSGGKFSRRNEAGAYMEGEIQLFWDCRIITR